MQFLNTSTWILLLFDAFGLWLLLRPSDLVNLWSGRRVRASDFDRFIAQMVGVIMLSAQVTYWVGQAKNTNAGPIVRRFSIVFWVGAGIFLAYRVVHLFGPKPDRRAQVDEAKRRYLLPESEEEARARYKAAWQEYRKLRVLFPLAVFGWLPFVVVLSAVLGLFLRFFHLSGNIWGVFWAILALAWVPFISISSWRWAFWRCPRCRYAFKGIYDPFFPKRCHYCDLPMWAESPDQ